VAFRKTNVYHYTLITNFCALTIYSQNINLLYMFRASSAHLQEDIAAHMQHMVLSLSVRVPGGLYVGCSKSIGLLVGKNTIIYLDV